MARRVTVHIKFRDSGLVSQKTYVYSKGSPTSQDLLVAFANDHGLDPTALLSCFGLTKSVKRVYILPLEQPVIFLSKSIWRLSRNYSITLHIAFFRLPRYWDPSSGLGDAKIHAMLFCELWHRYLSIHPPLPSSDSEKYAKMTATLSALLFLAQHQYASYCPTTRFAFNHTWSVQELVPHSCLNANHPWKALIEERLLLWSTSSHDSEKRIINWITLLTILEPFSFWRSSFHVDYLQLTGMTPDKEFMIRSTRYKLILSIGVDGIHMEWPGSKKEDRFLIKWNNMDNYCALEGSPGPIDGPFSSERVYFPFEWVLSVRPLTVPAIITKSDTSSSQVFLYEEEDTDMFASTTVLSQSNIIQPNTSMASLNGRTFRPSLASPRNQLPSPLPLPIKKDLITKNLDSSIILYIRLSAPMRNVDRSISSLILFKMDIRDYYAFNTLYEHYKEYHHGYSIRMALDVLTRETLTPAIMQIWTDCGWPTYLSDPSPDTMHLHIHAHPSMPIYQARQPCTSILQEIGPSHNIWIAQIPQPCDSLLQTLCTHYGMPGAKPLFGLQSSNRWLDSKISLLNQGFHFLYDRITFRLRWLVPVPDSWSGQHSTLINALFCHILDVMVKIDLPLDRGVFIRLCAAHLQLLSEKKPLPELLAGSEDPASAFMGLFTNLINMEHVLRAHCPIWVSFLKKKKASPDEALLRDIYAAWKELMQLVLYSSDSGWIERAKLVNLFEKRLSFLYFSWKPNYHRIGISTSGWALQRRGLLLRQTQYQSGQSWKCICNGLHIQFSLVKNTERSSIDRLVLNDSYAMFALHSLNIALAIQESFQLYRWLDSLSASQGFESLSRSGSTLSKGGLKRATIRCKPGSSCNDLHSSHSHSSSMEIRMDSVSVPQMRRSNTAPILETSYGPGVASQGNYGTERTSHAHSVHRWFGDLFTKSNRVSLEKQYKEMTSASLEEAIERLTIHEAEN